MIDIKDIYWLAGLLEGEGCFNLAGGNYPHIVVAMTDGDAVYHAARIFGGMSKVYEYTLKKSKKQCYRCDVYGNLAIQWMMTLYSLMHNRRKQKIMEIIVIWTAYDSQRRSRGTEFCLKGHELTEENSYMMHNSKMCKICQTDRINKYNEDRNKIVSSEEALEIVRKSLEKKGHDPRNLFGNDTIQ